MKYVNSFGRRVTYAHRVLGDEVLVQLPPEARTLRQIQMPVHEVAAIGQ